MKPILDWTKSKAEADDYSRDLRPVEWASELVLHSSNCQRRMSEEGLGRFKTFWQERPELGEVTA